MKRILCGLLAFAMCFALAGCSESTEETTAGTPAPVPVDTEGQTQPVADSIDVDLTTLSSTMVYSEVYNMITTPDDYLGKMVKMQGQFAVYEGEERNYYACLIADATACCSQGIEFVVQDNRAYPGDFPELGTEITVVGTFDTYQEGEYTYCQLIDATLLD